MPDETDCSCKVKHEKECPLFSRKPRGFAALTPEHRASISAMGGKTAHAMGLARVWTSEEAKVAGAKGGRVTQQKKATQKNKETET